jgi:hypothetical protein
MGAEGSRKGLPCRGPSRLLATLLCACAVGTVAAGGAGGAQARPTRPASPIGGAGAAAATPPACVIHSLPSFIAQGEREAMATVADIVEVECNPYLYGTGSRIRITADQLLSRCKGRLTWIVPNPFRKEANARGVTVALDADGNATVALIAGPECEAGESLVSAHLEQEPFETFTTSFTVLPPVTTPPGVFALPGTQVEDAASSGVAAIIQVEFAGGSEKRVRIGSEELFARCRVAPKLRWFQIVGGTEGAEVREVSGVSEVTGVTLDNDGNAFVVVIGDSSCAEGPSLIEADLESKPFTTFTTTFTTQPPQPTAEPSFTIEKLQQIAGAGSGFTTAPLTGSIGQVVDYQIVVKNTGNVPETFSEFSDPHCDPGTLAGGPGSSAVGPGDSTTYTCAHRLAQVGPYTNEAVVTGNTTGGTPVVHVSNQVLVTVPPEPAFTIEKLQKLAGSAGGFTTTPVTGVVGAKVEYEIVVKNTGNEPLTLSGFSDPRCDPETLAAGPGATPLQPGASTTYTCSHVLTGSGGFFNEATVTGTPPGEPPITHPSNRVEAFVPGPSAAPLPEQQQPIAVGPRQGVLPCEPASLILRGASGPKRAVFAVRIGWRRVAQLTLYLDRRKLTTLKLRRSQVQGSSTIKIDARTLSYGGHRVKVAAVPSNPICGVSALSSVFVHPRPGRPAPPTG